MRRFIVSVLFLLLLLFIFGGLIHQSALAKSQNSLNPTPVLLGQTSPKEEIKLEARFPELRGTAGSFFEFEVELKYTGKEPRVFDLSAEAPPGFFVSIRPGHGGMEIASIRLDPDKAFPERVRVAVTPIFLLFPERLPEPGEYIVTLFVSAKGVKELTGSIDLKAIITAKHDLRARTGGVLEGRLNMNATAGEDNPLPIIIANTGTATLKNITFTTEKPGGWSITFSPETIDTLSAGAIREVEVNIKPPRRTIAGDYVIALKVDEESRLAFDRLDIRVTVLTPTLWGWVGVGIVVAVVVGLAVIFMRLGRR